jgi:hypothetical protein
MEKRFFSSPQHPYQLLGPPLSEYVKQPGREADRSASSSAEVKNGGAIPPHPHTSSWHGALLIKHRNNFAITFYVLPIMEVDRKY